MGIKKANVSATNGGQSVPINFMDLMAKLQTCQNKLFIVILGFFICFFFKYNILWKETCKNIQKHVKKHTKNIVLL